jgi:hypothetical protein
LRNRAVLGIAALFGGARVRALAAGKQDMHWKAAVFNLSGILLAVCKFGLAPGQARSQIPFQGAHSKRQRLPHREFEQRTVPGRRRVELSSVLMAIVYEDDRRRAHSRGT